MAIGAPALGKPQRFGNLIKTSVHVEGLSELETALLEFSKATAGNILKRTVAAPAADFADLASTLAPRGATGKLKESIKVDKPRIITAGQAAFAKEMREGGTRAEAAAAARAANRAAGGTGRSAITNAGPTRQAYYGQFQEFGTRHHPPQPFMRPAWDALGPSLITTAARVLAEEIEKTRKRVAANAARRAAKMRA
jgi:HK97 gp10 family phage protein